MVENNKDGGGDSIVKEADVKITLTQQKETNGVDDRFKSVKLFAATPTDTKEKYRMLGDHICNKYEEAALYLAEGLEDENLDNHPTNARCYAAYKVFHNPIYYITELVVCILLLLMGLMEEPTFLDYDILNHVIAPSLELLFLLFLSGSAILKFLWKCRFSINDHRFTLIKIILILVMCTEAIVVLSRSKSHFRIVRCLRPLFLLSTTALKDVKRMLWQIFKCIGPIIDVLLLLFFFIAIFAVSGFYLFGAISQSATNHQFDSFEDSFISLYILITTANFPDVMMQYYDRKPLAPLFFIIFLIIGLYIIMNVLLAVIHSTFKDVQKEKFKNIYLHKRNALCHAFHVLSIQQSQQDIIPMEIFLELMHYYSPYTSKLTCVCMFKAMMKEEREQSYLKIEEFCSFYEFQRILWIRLYSPSAEARWYHRFSKCWPKLEKLTKFVYSQCFIATMNMMVFANAIIFFILLSVHAKDHKGKFEQSIGVLISNTIFIVFYLLEIALKLFALGPAHFFRYYWNIFDFSVIVISTVVQLFEFYTTSLNFLVPLRFIRLIRFNKRFHALVNALALVLPRIFNIMVLLMLIYYFFAIIGMECFNGTVFPHCCNDSKNVVGQYYTGNENNKYYLNNFDSLSQSYVTLFELMVVNNWWIIMEGFHFAVGDRRVRTFFILFHLTTAVS